MFMVQDDPIILSLNIVNIHIHSELNDKITSPQSKVWMFLTTPELSELWYRVCKG